MKILVTGSSGFIGQHVFQELKVRGHDPVKFDKPFDVCDYRDLQTFGAVEAVIHLAGRLGTPELFGSEYAAAKVNILGAINIFDWARDLDIPVVQIGTGHKGQPNPYAITKGCAEDLALARAQWLGEKISVVRAYHVYGPGQIPGPPHGPASVHKFFPTFACRALQVMPLELCGGGSQLIDPVHVAEAAYVLADAVAGPYGEITEAGCGKPFSVQHVAQDIADAVRERTEMPGPIVGVPVPDRQGEPHGASVVASKPACTRVWPYMVPETVEWYAEWLRSRS